jgi:hypothetical protein
MLVDFVSEKNIVPAKKNKLKSTNYKPDKQSPSLAISITTFF